MDTAAPEPTLPESSPGPLAPPAIVRLRRPGPRLLAAAVVVVLLACAVTVVTIVFGTGHRHAALTRTLVLDRPGTRRCTPGAGPVADPSKVLFRMEMRNHADDESDPAVWTVHLDGSGDRLRMPAKPDADTTSDSDAAPETEAPDTPTPDATDPDAAAPDGADPDQGSDGDSTGDSTDADPLSQADSLCAFLSNAGEGARPYSTMPGAERTFCHWGTGAGGTESVELRNGTDAETAVADLYGPSPDISVRDGAAATCDEYSCAAAAPVRADTTVTVSLHPSSTDYTTTVDSARTDALRLAADIDRYCGPACPTRSN